jgi:hypothetical protein
METGLGFLGAGDNLPVIACFFIGAATAGWGALTSFLLADALPYLGAAAGLRLGSGWDGVVGFTIRTSRTTWDP